jgi:hypothetical protein
LLVGLGITVAAGCSSTEIRVSGAGNPSEDGGVGNTDGGSNPKPAVAETPSTRFEPKAKPWAVPARGIEGGFSAVGNVHWSTIDLDGDGHDL